MPFVIVDGTGTYAPNARWTFRPGATEVPEGDPVLSLLRAKGPKWVTVQATRKPPEVKPKPKEVKAPRPWDTFQGRDKRWYFLSPSGRQSDPFDSESTAQAAADKEKMLIPLAEDMPKKKLPSGEDPLGRDAFKSEDVYCRHPDCDAGPFRNKGTETNHARIKHPELFASAD